MGAHRSPRGDLCTYPGTKKAVVRTLDFHFNPPITAEDNATIANAIHNI